MKKFIILLFIIPLLFVARAQSQPQDLELDAPTQALLHTLDDIIQNHKVQYQAQRIKQINQLKAQARTATGYNKYNLYKEIFDLYSHFQTDSAQVYICKMQQLPAYKTDVVMQATLHVAQAESWRFLPYMQKHLVNSIRCPNRLSVLNMPNYDSIITV